MSMAMDKAKKEWNGNGAVRNSTHYADAGYYALIVWRGGVTGKPGTNPLAIGFPSGEDFPFLLDCVISVTQRGRINMFVRDEKPAWMQSRF